MKKKRVFNTIPTKLTEEQFNEFVLPHLKKGDRGPDKKVSFYKIFNYILILMHTGCQWYNLPIEKDSSGNYEIHYTRVFKSFKYWLHHGCFDKIFESSVLRLATNKMLDLSVIHGDGTSNCAKKGVII
jgi:transposase